MWRAGREPRGGNASPLPLPRPPTPLAVTPRSGGVTQVHTLRERHKTRHTINPGEKRKQGGEWGQRRGRGGLRVNPAACPRPRLAPRPATSPEVYSRFLSVIEGPRKLLSIGMLECGAALLLRVAVPGVPVLAHRRDDRRGAPPPPEPVDHHNGVDHRDTPRGTSERKLCNFLREGLQSFERGGILGSRQRVPGELGVPTLGIGT